MAESKKVYKGGNINSIKVPEFKRNNNNIYDLVDWGKKAWEFLEKLKTKPENGSKNSKWLISTGYEKLMKKLEKILTVGGAGPEDGMYFAYHRAGQKDEFSKALKEYAAKGKDVDRKKKIEELRKYYKDTILKEQADLIMSNNTQLSGNKDGRGFTGMKVITLRGEAWKILKLPDGKNEGPFQNLTSLKRLVLGPEVKKIGPNCFKGCEKLKTIEVEGTGKAIEVDENAFKGCTKVTKVEGDKERTENLRNMFMKGILAGKKGTIGSTLSSIFSGSKSAKKSVEKDVKDSESDKSNVLEQLSNKKENVGFWLSSSKLKSVQKSAKKS